MDCQYSLLQIELSQSIIGSVGKRSLILEVEGVQVDSPWGAKAPDDQVDIVSLEDVVQGSIF